MSLNHLTKKLKKEDGVTLVELLAAIAILSIIVTAFLAFFTQAGRTNNITDEMNEATFIAVEEMELITNLSQQGKTHGEMKAFYQDDENYEVTGDATKLTITRVLEKGSTSLIIALPDDKAELPDNLYHVSVKVTEGGEQNRADMQTILPFTEPETDGE